MIDLGQEELISLAEAARRCPGGGTHVSTVWRWVRRGVRSIQLELSWHAVQLESPGLFL